MIAFHNDRRLIYSYSDSGGGGSRPGKLKQSRGQHYSSKKEEEDMVSLCVFYKISVTFTNNLAENFKMSN
jgi:hypothetical protein